MKNLLNILCTGFLFCCTGSITAQQKLEVTGVWTGEIYNDSTQQYIPFELAISQRNGVYTAYSYTVFIIDSTENIGVKEVTVTEKGDRFIVKDKRLIDDNYTDRPAKGVYTTFELLHTHDDSTDFLSGRWFTNKTRQFYPLSGSATLSKRKRIEETRIIPRLTDLGLAHRLSFVSHARQQEVSAARSEPPAEEMITIVEPALVIELPSKDTSERFRLPAAAELAQLIEPEQQQSAAKPSDNRTAAAAQVRERGIDGQPAMQPPVKDAGAKTRATPALQSAADSVPATLQTAGTRVAAETVARATRSQAMQTAPDSAKAAPGKPGESVTSSPVRKTATTGEVKPLQVMPTVPTHEPAAPLAVAAMEKDLSARRIETIQSVRIRGDSVVLSLYDNGVVDGDTVSVLLNESVIVSRVGLLTTAFNHTVHLTPDMGDSIKIILYAENLGSIPPNTGLLVIRDGRTNHEIRFSGDLKHNSAIILLRNKDEEIDE